MSKKLIFSSIIGAILLIGIFSLGFFIFQDNSNHIALAQSGSINTPGSHALKGYAWSSNIGWIHFNPNYGGVFLDGTTGNLSGYAWANPKDDIGQSNNIGWLSFNDYSSCGGTRPNINLTSGAVTGWAKFVSADNADWDGCVHLTGTNYSSSVNLSNNQFTSGSYFWGGPSVIGWIHLCGSNYCVSVDTSTTTLPIKPGKPGNPQQTNAGACDSFGGVISMLWSAGNPAPSSPGGYYIYRTDASGNTIYSKSFSASTNTTISTGLTPNTTYYFKVTAFNSGAGQEAESDPSGVVAMTSSKNTCQAAAITFKATPSTVPAGGFCNLAWTVTFAANCRITSTGDTKFPFNFVSASGTTASSPTVGTTTTSAIYRTYNYTLTCGSLSATTKCAIAPKYQEI